MASLLSSSSDNPSNVFQIAVHWTKSSKHPVKLLNSFKTSRCVRWKLQAYLYGYIKPFLFPNFNSRAVSSYGPLSILHRLIVTSLGVTYLSDTPYMEIWDPKTCFILHCSLTVVPWTLFRITFAYFFTSVVSFYPFLYKMNVLIFRSTSPLRHVTRSPLWPPSYSHYENLILTKYPCSLLWLVIWIY